MEEIAYQRYAAPLERTIVVGDIHGCYDEMLQLLRLVEFTKRDVLISVGDLVDRGPNSREVVHYFMEHENAIAVAGNHERKIRRILEDGLRPGAMQTFTLNELSDEEVGPIHAYLRGLPAVIETPAVVVVHARLDPAKTLIEQNLKYCAGVGGPSVEIPVDQDGVPLWYRDWCRGWNDDGHEPESGFPAAHCEPKPICFGHLQYSRVELVPRCLFALDTSAVGAGHLTAYVVEENRIVDVKVSRDYFSEARLAWKALIVTHADVRTQTIKAIERIREPEVIHRQHQAFEEAGFFQKIAEINRRIGDLAGPPPESGPERGEYVQAVRGWFHDVPPRIVNMVLRGTTPSWDVVRSVFQHESLVSLMGYLEKMEGALTEDSVER